jgi:hypothetical protein
MLRTDAAAEGLNLQTCRVLINYDLPWNMMCVKYRIGRIDRIGQPRDVIRIVNLYHTGSIEMQVYRRLGGGGGACHERRDHRHSAGGRVLGALFRVAHWTVVIALASLILAFVFATLQQHVLLLGATAIRMAIPRVRLVTETSMTAAGSCPAEVFTVGLTVVLPCPIRAPAHLARG